MITEKLAHHHAAHAAHATPAPAPAPAPKPTPTGERADLLKMLAQHRKLLRRTVRDLTDEQARMRPTASELCLGGLIKHVAEVEQGWADFILGGPDTMKAAVEADPAERDNGFRLLPDETLAGVLADYAEVARRTDELVATLTDFGAEHPLPEAPWFEPGARWSARRTLIHIMTETAQHAGHADIIRETLDGAKTMG